MYRFKKGYHGTKNKYSYIVNKNGSWDCKIRLDRNRYNGLLISWILWEKQNEGVPRDVRLQLVHPGKGELALHQETIHQLRFLHELRLPRVSLKHQAPVRPLG